MSGEIQPVVSEVTASSDPERLARARYLDRQVQGLRDLLTAKWHSLSSILHPIWEEKLYEELGFRTWSSYLESTFHQPVTTINNYLLPYRRLLQSGLDPATIADVPLSNANELAALARANGGVIDPEILEKAREPHTRQQAQEFREMVRIERRRLSIEEPRKVGITCQESLYTLWRLGCDVTARLDGSPTTERRHEALCLEVALVAFLESEEAKRIMEIHNLG